MNINGVNIFIILLGIVICFFGIYFKKAVQIIMGFVWGAGIAYLFVLFLSAERIMSGGDADELIAVLIVLAVGILMAFLAVKLERLLVTIQGVLLSMLITLLICSVCFRDASTAFAVILLLLVAVVTGYLLWMYYRYAFICETAVVGSIMINHIWLFGSEDLEAFCVILTIAVAAAGIKVQSMWLRKMEGRTTGNRIHVKSKNLINRQGIRTVSISGLFSNEDVKKASVSDICTYEKWLVLVPIITFSMDEIVSMYLYNISQATAEFFGNTWEIRAALKVILTGVFVGCVIYFIIYYEIKVAAIYQLFYFVWLLFDIIRFIQYSYIDLQYCLRMILAYYILWIIFAELDHILHSEKLKIIAMTVLAALWFPFVSEYIMYGYMNIYMNYLVVLTWIGIVGAVLGLAWVRKNREY